jgi:hypothetical protein
MAHSHSHAAGEVEGNYFLDQLFTILTCGGIGLVAVLMYYTGTLGRILVEMFFVPVLLGGIAILALVTVRAIAVWKLAGARQPETNNHAAGHEHAHGHEHSHSHGGEACGHDHAHGDECGHDHAHSHSHAHAHSHSHDEHDHEHSWAPWRYMVLAIPVFLYFLGLPREGITQSEVDRQRSQGALQQSPARQGLSMLAGGTSLTKALRKTDPKRMPLRFKELTQAAAIPARQEIYEGEIGILRGQYVPLRSSDREFTLLRVDRTCCVADEIYLETRIEAPESIQGVQPYQWVRVEGLISFQRNERGKWIPVITLASNADIDTNVEPTNDANIP